MYRPQIRVLDATVRDGGLMNNSQFELDFVRAVYRALSEAGVDYMEVGYRNSRSVYSPDEYGPWRFCDEDDLRRVIDGVESEMKLSAMVDIDRCDLDDFCPCEESVLDMVRVATYVKDIDKAIALVNGITARGYECTCNIMAVSHALDTDLTEALEQLAETDVKVVYVVDSFGALYCEQIEYLVKKYRAALPGKEVGIHGHNNQQLAYANTIEGIIHGANYVDGTLYGIGRAAGNCPLELLVGFLKNPKFELTPIFEVLQEHVVPMLESGQIEWGYLVPYMITGMLDEHPRSAMALRSSDRKNEFAAFYRQMVETEE